MKIFIDTNVLLVEEKGGSQEEKQKNVNFFLEIYV